MTTTLVLCDRCQHPAAYYGNRHTSGIECGCYVVHTEFYGANEYEIAEWNNVTSQRNLWLAIQRLRNMLILMS